jgi:hypothetical protein
MHRFSYQTFTFGRWYEHTIAWYTIVGFRTDIKLLEIFVHKNNRGKKRNRKWDSKWNWPSWYNRNIVESGVKHHNSNTTKDTISFKTTDNHEKMCFTCTINVVFEDTKG